jgi:hypothetical protein
MRNKKIGQDRVKSELNQKLIFMDRIICHIQK